MSIKYNVSDTPLKLREYGRNIQMMVDQARVMDDDITRNALVHEIVRIMINVNPQWKDIPDYQRKVWDHFYFLADFNIKIDTDFPMPTPEEVYSKPVESMPYHDGKPRFRQYGKNVDLMVTQAVAMEPSRKKEALINLIANIMRMHLKHEDREANATVTISQHLKLLSKGEIDIHPDDIHLVKLPRSSQGPNNNNMGNNHNNNNNNYNNNNRNHGNNHSNHRGKKKNYGGGGGNYKKKGRR